MTDAVEPVPDDVVTPVASSDDDDRRATRLSWLYLLVLFGVFAAVALLAFQADDAVVETAATTTAAADASSEFTSVDLEFVVDGESVTLRGAVPDVASRDSLLQSAQDRYERVVDELVIDEGTTMDGGRLNISGNAFEGDTDAAGLQADAAASLGLEAGGFDVALIELDETPVDAQVRISTNTVVLTGSFPDQVSLDEFEVASFRIFGQAMTDSSALVVDPDTTLTNSTITISGLVDAGDFRAEALATELSRFFGASSIDGSSVSFDTSPDALGRLESQLRAQVAATPILFESGSADIQTTSDDILTNLALAINAAPDVPVEIVGHTDSSGDAGTNQLLSEDRAVAVVDRLVSLGVDEARLSARGAGENEPIADNETDEGKAANRRIEFEFEGATSDEPAEDETDEDASTDEESDE